MVWIKETKNQGEVSKNKTLQFSFRRLQRPGEGAKVQQRCAPSGKRSAASRLGARSPRPLPPPGSGSRESLARSLTRGPLDGKRRATGRGPERSQRATGAPTVSPRGRSPRARAQLSRRPGSMRPPTTARCPGRVLQNPWRSFWPLTLALFVGMGQAQRDPVGRYEPAGRDASRLRRPGGSPVVATAKVYSLFREQDAPVRGSPPAELVQPSWGSPRRSTEAEARRPPRAQQPRRVQPPAQTWRSRPSGQQQSAPRARAAPALPRLETVQRPRAARGRLTG